LGLLSDQHPGANGVPLPFLGRECTHSAAPAVFALRYNCALFTGICFRVGLARWRIEAGEEIPTHENGHPRSVEAITADIVKALEAAVRRELAEKAKAEAKVEKTAAKPPQSPSPDLVSGPTFIHAGAVP
jgi:lauroyl/myristoyl acyltransferase